MDATEFFGKGLHNIANQVLCNRYRSRGHLNMAKVMFDVSKLYELTFAQLTTELDQQQRDFPGYRADPGRRAPNSPGGHPSP